MKMTTALNTLITVTLTKTTSIVEHVFNSVDAIAESGEVMSNGFLADTKDAETVAQADRDAAMKAHLKKLKELAK